METPAKNLLESLARCSETIAFLMIVSITAARCFLGEVSYPKTVFDVNQLLFDPAQALIDFAILIRIKFTFLLGVAGGFWILSQLLNPAKKILNTSLSLLFALGVFSLCWGLFAKMILHSSVSSNSFELQAGSILLAGFAMFHMCTDKRKFVLLVWIASAIGLGLLLKSLFWLAIEHPAEQNAFFKNMRENLLVAGISDPESPAAKLFIGRLEDSSLRGFFPLANIFGSMMILPALCLGGFWFCAKCKSAKWVFGIFALLTACLVFLSQSKGAIISLCAVVAIAIFFWRARAKLTANFRVFAVVGAIGFLLIGAGLIYQAQRDPMSFPGKTMQVRAMYWQTSMKIFDENSEGTGLVEFGAAFRKAQSAQCDESVQDPHNFIALALAGLGSVRGVIFIALLLGAVAFAFKPGDQQGEFWRVKKRYFALTGCAVSAGLLLFCGSEAATDYEKIFNVGLPAFGVAVGLIIFARVLLRIEFSDRAIERIRFAVALGGAAFLLHNLVTFSLFMPASSMMFWVLIAGCAGAGNKISCPDWKIALPLRIAFRGVPTYAIYMMMLVSLASLANLWFSERPGIIGQQMEIAEIKSQLITMNRELGAKRKISADQSKELAERIAKLGRDSNCRFKIPLQEQALRLGRFASYEYGVTPREQAKIFAETLVSFPGLDSREVTLEESLNAFKHVTGLSVGALLEAGRFAEHLATVKGDFSARQRAGYRLLACYYYNQAVAGAPVDSSLIFEASVACKRLGFEADARAFAEQGLSVDRKLRKAYPDSLRLLKPAQLRKLEAILSIPETQKGKVSE